MRRTVINLLVAYLVLAVCSSCSGKHGPQAGGETHWLAACTQDEECGGADLSCMCGTCTRACSVDLACTGGREAACFNPKSPLLLQRCEDRGAGSSQGLCLPRCTKDADCGTGRACVQRTCVPTAPPDAGAPSPTASADAGLHTSDFNNVSDSVSWTQPITVPAPQVAIAGADERILGTWREVDCDPTQPMGNDLWGCMSLVVERTASGDVTGSFLVHRPDHNPIVPDLPPNGPFQPPTDPDVGYPTEVDTKEYGNIANNIAGEAPYRMLDGHFENGLLRFVFSPYDLWHGWCQLQKSYPWQIGDHGFYFCVPQDAAAQTSIDEGKMVLCSSPDLGPLCSDGQGGVRPCSCISGASDSLRCSSGFCHCDGQGCDANLHSSQYQFHLTLEGERMSGTWHYLGLTTKPATLERVSP